MADVFAKSPQSRTGSPGASRMSEDKDRSVENLGYFSGLEDGTYFQMPGPSHLNNITNTPSHRRWSIKEFSLPKLPKGKGDAVSSRIPILDEDIGEETSIPSKFVQTDDSMLEKDDTFLWEYDESHYCAVVDTLKEVYSTNRNELYNFVSRNDDEFLFEDRFGTSNWAVKLRGDETTPDQSFAGIISWTQLNLAQINYDIDEEGFRDGDKRDNPPRNSQPLKVRIRKAIEPFKKGQFAESLMTIIGKENKVFESTFHEYSQKEEDLLQKLYGKKNEEFYLLKFAAARPTCKDPKYRIEDMLLTWFCYSADVARVACVHILADPSLMPLFRKFGFQVGLCGNNDSVRLRDRVSKLHLPLLYRPRALPLLSIRPVLVPMAAVENIHSDLEPSIEQIIHKEAARDALRSPSLVDLSLKENDNPETPKTPKRNEGVRASSGSQPVQYHGNSDEGSQPGTQIPLIPVVPLNELKYQGTPARPSDHQTGDLREIPNTRNSILIGRARAPSNATPDIKWRNPTRFLHEQQDEVMEEKKPNERTVSRIPSLRRANSKGSQRSTKPSKLSQKSSIMGYVWRDSKPGMAAALAESRRPFTKLQSQRDSRKAFNRRSLSSVSPDYLSSTVGPPASGISRAQSVPGRSSPRIDPRTGLTVPRQVRKPTPSPETLSPTSPPPFPLRRKATRIRANTVDDHENPFATINGRKSQPPPPPDNTPNTTPATKSAPEVPVGEVAIFCDNFEPVDIEDADDGGYEGDDDKPLENSEDGETKRVVSEEQDGEERQKNTVDGDKGHAPNVDVEIKNQQADNEPETTTDLDKFKRKEISPQLLADEAFLRDISSTLSLGNMDGDICELNDGECLELLPIQSSDNGLEHVIEVAETLAGVKQLECNDNLKQDKGEKEKVKKTVTFKEPEVEWVAAGSETASVDE